MTDFPYRSALIVGAGPGISASLARRLAGLGVKVALAARNVQKLHSLVEDVGAEAFAVDASDPESVAKLFVQVGDRMTVRAAERPDPADKPDSTLDPDAIAQAYIDVLRQPRSARSNEVELRPWVEHF
jgi:NAD(P)-dependent dehydrogenase (short-subunit alcohol dehydrogenase family)